MHAVLFGRGCCYG